MAHWLVATALAASRTDQIAEVKALIGRVWSPTAAEAFDLDIPVAYSTHRSADFTPGAAADWFAVSDSAPGRVAITGTSGVALAVGFNWYLRHVCNQSVSWIVSSTTPLSPPPAVGAAATNATATVPVRYYMNICTLSYSSAFWDWRRWEHELDWMALHGVTAPLSPTGQEAVWADVFLAMGMTEADLADFFAGPAFLAWGRMGNLLKWGGPLTKDWRDAQAALQLRILARARRFGMRPILPAFAGFVPAAVQALHPDAKLRNSSDWAGFAPPYSGTLLVDPTDPLFHAIGTAFLSAQASRFGSDGLYSCDTFNEMDPSSSDLGYLAAASRAVVDSMLAVDPTAVWVMQAWLFHSDYWSDARMAAYLSGPPAAHILVLDLNSEASPVWRRIVANSDKSFVWNALIDYGGQRTLFGDLHTVTAGQRADLAAAGARMVGVGITPEAIENNDVAFASTFHAVWEQPPATAADVAVAFARQRYGSAAADAAWQALGATVYGGQAGQMLSVLADTPGLGSRRNGYQPDVVVAAATTLLAAATEVPAYGLDALRYDIVDTTRQVLADLASDYSAAFDAAYGRCLGGSSTSSFRAHPNCDGDTPGMRRIGDPQPCGYGTGRECNVTALQVECAAQADCGGINSNGWVKAWGTQPASQNGVEYFERIANAFPQGCGAAQVSMNSIAAARQALMAAWDAVLGTHRGFLLGVWLNSARALGATAAAADANEFNARNQITLWGPDGQINNYAAKEWAGLGATYYRDRWAAFYRRFANLTGPADLGPTFHAEQLRIGRAWCQQTNATQPFPSTPSGVAEDVAAMALAQFAPAAVPTVRYRLIAGRTAAGVPGAIVMWSHHAGALSALCDADPSCSAFSDDGTLVSGAPAPAGTPATGVTMWVKVSP